MQGRKIYGVSLFILCALGFSCDRCLAQLPQPHLDRVFPLGGQAGTHVLLDLTGRDLDDVKSLSSDHPGLRAEFVKPNQFRLSIATDTPPGTHDLRAIGKYGLSNARLFVVSRGLKEISKTQPNSTPDKPLVIVVNTAISGLSAANGYDYYRFPARKGQRLTIDCQAFCLESLLRGQLVLFDAKGKEVARGRPHTNGIDPLIDFRVPEDQEYVLRLHDITYTGDLPFRLVVSDHPHVEYAFPPALVPGKETKLALGGQNLPSGRLIPGPTPREELEIAFRVPADEKTLRGSTFINLPAAPSLNARTLELWPPGIANLQNPVTVLYTTAPVVCEHEPNDTPETAQAVTLPSVVCGRFDKPGDQDWYTFTAKAGETIALDLYCERLNYPGDPYLLVTDAKGTELVALDDQGNNINALAQFNRDPVGTLAIPADGTYRIVVRERNRKGGPRYLYALRLSKLMPDFYPVVYHETPNEPTCPTIRQGGASFYEFCVNRRDGFDAPVTVQAEGLPAGVRCRPVHVSSQTETASIVFEAARDAPAWSGAIRLKAEAMIAGKRVAREVDCVQRRWGNGVGNNACRVCREIGLAVRSTAPYGLRTTADKLKVTAGDTVETTISLERYWPDLKGSVQLGGLNLPPGFEVQPATIAADKQQTILKIKAAAEVPPGVYSIIVRGDAQVPFQADPANGQKADVRVADPAPPLTLEVLARKQ
jgi:hypothetical protein